MSRRGSDSYERHLYPLRSDRTSQATTAGNRVRSRSRSPLSYGSCSSKEELEWLDYQLARRLQAEVILEPNPVEDTLDEEQLERILGSSFTQSVIPRRIRAGARSPSIVGSPTQHSSALVRESSRESDEEMYPDDPLSLTLTMESSNRNEDFLNLTPSDGDDVDVGNGDGDDDDDDDDSYVDVDDGGHDDEHDDDDDDGVDVDDDEDDDEDVDSADDDAYNNDSGHSDRTGSGTRRVEEELQSSDHSEQAESSDNDDPEESEVDVNRSEPTEESLDSDYTENIFDTMDILENLSRQVIRPLAVLASLAGIDVEEEEQEDGHVQEFNEEEPDDSVIRSDAFGRCTICFEEVPYDPVGCLYCQQSIGCRRCVIRWYEAFDHRNSADFDILGGHPPVNHKKCPLCRHVWEEQAEVTSMFLLKDDFP
ncbi:hypothetical protein V3C99_015075 [Haemonchus contortus]